MGPQSGRRAHSLLLLAVACLCALQLSKTQQTQAAAVLEPSGHQTRVTQDKGPADAEQLALEEQPRQRQLLGAGNDDDDDAAAAADDDEDFDEDERAPLRKLDRSLAPGEQKVMMLGERAARARASQLNGDTKQHVRLVHETLPDGRKVTYEIVDELIEDEEEEEEQEEQEEQPQQQKQGDAELRAKVVERPEAPAVAEQAGGEVSVKPRSSEPAQPAAQDLAKERPDKLPTVSNSAVASVQLAPGAEQAAAKRQSGEPSEQQQAHEEKTPQDGTKPAAVVSAEQGGQPELAKADVREQEPAKAEQRNEQQTTDHSDAPTETTTTTAATEAPVAPATDRQATQVDDLGAEPPAGETKPRMKDEKNEPEAKDEDNQPEVKGEKDEPEAEVSPQPQNVAIKGVGNKKRKVVDKLEKNIVKASPNEISIEDSGNQTDEVLIDRKVNEVIAPSKSAAKGEEPKDANGVEAKEIEEVKKTDDAKEPDDSKEPTKEIKSKKNLKSKKDKSKKTSKGETLAQESSGDEKNNEPVAIKDEDKHERENESEPAETEAPQQVESDEDEPDAGSDHEESSQDADDQPAPTDEEKGTRESIDTQSEGKEPEEIKKPSEDLDQEQEVAKDEPAGESKPEKKKKKRPKKGKESKKPEQSIEADLRAKVTQDSNKAAAVKEPQFETNDERGLAKTNQPSEAASEAKQVVAPESQVTVEGADGGQVDIAAPASAPAVQQVPVQQPHNVQAANSPGPNELLYVQPGTQQQTIVQPGSTTSLVEEHEQQQQQSVVDPNSQTVIVEEHTTVHEDGQDDVDGNDLDEEEWIEIEESGGRRGRHRRHRGRRGRGRWRKRWGRR